MYRIGGNARLELISCGMGNPCLVTDTGQARMPAPQGYNKIIQQNYIHANQQWLDNRFLDKYDLMWH
jgi:hypothetical protein